jgi:hypothetical protein
MIKKFRSKKSKIKFKKTKTKSKKSKVNNKSITKKINIRQKDIYKLKSIFEKYPLPMKLNKKINI